MTERMQVKTEDRFKASIIIVNFNGKDDTTRCLSSLFRFLPDNEYQIIIVDNNSKDDSVESLKSNYPKIEIIERKENEGFGRANNTGAEIAAGKYLFFLNNDTELISDILTPMTDFLNKNPEVGVVGPRILNSDLSFQLSSGKFPSILNEYAARKWQIQSANNKHYLKWKNKQEQFNTGKVDWVTGAALLIRRSIFEKIGGFDRHYFMYFEDSDLCLKVKRLGYATYWISEYSLLHYKGRSYSQADSLILEEYRKSQLHYYDKNKSFFEKILLRIYLILKYSLRLLLGNDRRTSKKILKQIF
jgi:GT2 family glycosyltransferase